MAQFIVRNLEDDVHARLRELAKAQGQSLEEFVREMLRGVALESPPPKRPFGVRLVERFSDCRLADGETIMELKGQPARAAEFD